MQFSAMLIPTLVWWSDADAGETKQWSEYKRPAKRGRYKSGARNGVSTDLSRWWVNVLIDRCLYWLWSCGLRDCALLSCVSLGLPTCSAPGGECSLMLPLCIVICSLPCNGQSLVLQACNNWSACISCLTVYTVASYCIWVAIQYAFTDLKTGLRSSIEQNDGIAEVLVK